MRPSFYGVLALISTGSLLSGTPDPSHSDPIASETPPGMVLIPGGAFKMGGDPGLMDGDSQSHQTAYPIHEVVLDPFWIDETEVTNREFAKFVEATDYETFAERPLPPEVVEELQQMAAESLRQFRKAAESAEGRQLEEINATIQRIEEASQFGDQAGSVVFKKPEGEIYDPKNLLQWWQLLPSATWRTPGGPGSSWQDRLDHPVVNVTYQDAAAYAEWAGKRLPTEAEWERAARGGLEHQPYVWGDELHPQGEGIWMANIWQGEWPHENEAGDGFPGTAPVKSFPPNPYGLYDMAGNVWEIVADIYHPHTYRFRKDREKNPQGPDAEQLSSAGIPTSVHVTRGGSFLCSAQWCSGYKPGSRQSLEDDSPAHHTGFRCARDVETP